MSYATGIAIYNCGKFSNDKKKGDNAIIDCGNKDYLMIDCGPKDSAESYVKALASKCKPKTSGAHNGKVYVKALVLSHNHKDHVEGLATLLASDKLYIEKVYYTYPGSQYSNVVSALTGHSSETVGVGVCKTVTVNDTVLKIYGPSQAAYDAYDEEFSNYNSSQANNASMICTITNTSTDNPYRALFLGDLNVAGLGYAIDSWGTEVFFPASTISSLHYNFCKFGHHGQRSSANYQSNSNLGPTEINNYNTRIKANNYFMTVTKAHLVAADSELTGTPNWDNYEYIEGLLSGNIRRYIRDTSDANYRVWYVYNNWN